MTVLKLTAVGSSTGVIIPKDQLRDGCRAEKAAPHSEVMASRGSDLASPRIPG